MIITDSLGAPRKGDETIFFIHTWPYKLQKLMLFQYDYYNFIYTQKALDSDELKRLVDLNLDLYDKRFVFLQLGIVDCVRRVLSKKTIKVINILPGIRNVVYFFASHYHKKLTGLYNINYVPIKRFDKNITYVINKFQEAEKIFLIPILPAGKDLSNKSYNVQEQIIYYNSVLKRISESYHNTIYCENIFNSFIPINEKYYTEDGYHISTLGHDVIFNLIKMEYLPNRGL